MGVQTRHSRPNGGNAWVNPALNPARTRHGFFKPCTDGSFPLIFVKHTRQVVRIEVMRADLLWGCDVDGDLLLMRI